MNTVLLVLLMGITAAIAVLVVYLIQVLLQLKETLKSVEELIENLNKEVAKVDSVIENVAEASKILAKFGKIGTPALSILGFIFGLVKGFGFPGKKKNNNWKEGE